MTRRTGRPQPPAVPGRWMPRYPIFIPTKGRAGLVMSTANCLVEHGVPFRLVVEPQEAEAYGAEFGEDRLLVLPFQDRGSVVPARNFIKDQAAKEGYERHWQIDDNIYYFWRRWQGRRIRCDPGVALRVVEDFADRYENVAILGLNYDMFAPDLERTPPFVLNCHVYSCMLMRTDLPHRWRGIYNEDTDMCLQVLADNWCTVLVNVFLVKKKITMVTRGGNLPMYVGDGRRKMARELERRWPGVVDTKRRYGRPQHVIAASWRKFDTPLKLKPGVDLDALREAGDPYGIQLAQVSKKIESKRLRKLFKDYQDR